MRNSPAHLAALDAVRTSTREPQARDISTADDMMDRDIRIETTQGVVHAVYNRHAEMFSLWALPSQSYLGAIDAPWIEA